MSNPYGGITSTWRSVMNTLLGLSPTCSDTFCESNWSYQTKIMSLVKYVLMTRRTLMQTKTRAKAKAKVRIRMWPPPTIAMRMMTDSGAHYPTLPLFYHIFANAL